MSNLEQLKERGRAILDRRHAFVDGLRAPLGLSEAEWKPVLGFMWLTGRESFNIYAIYPHLFAKAFPRVSDQVLDALGLAGRYALDYIVLYDHLIDSKSKPERPLVLLSYALQRAYLLGLGQIFAPKSPVWQSVEALELQTGQALLAETSRKLGPPCIPTRAAVEHEAIGKAAMSRLALTCLKALSPRVSDEVVSGLTRSNDLYNFARQIIDDISDWRKDLAEHAISQPLTAAAALAGCSAEDLREPRPEVTQRVASRFYTHVAPEYLAWAAQALRESERLAQTHNANEAWLQIVRGVARRVQTKREIIAETLRHVERDHARPPQPRTLQGALQGATAFLLERQEENGNWRDFATQAQESVDWITGYVGWSLAQAPVNHGDALARAAAWVLKTQAKTGGWGYHDRLITDTDSTAWCLRFLRAMRIDPAQFATSTASFARSQRADGGFATYDAPEQIRQVIRAPAELDFGGWCGAQNCVTAVGLATLLDLDLDPDRVTSALDYLDRQQGADGAWQSYWWQGPAYATAHTLDCLARLPKSRDRLRAELALTWFVEHQNADGGWCAPGRVDSNPFHTALALFALCAIAPTPVTSGALQHGADWLINTQLEDGSWRPSAILQIPSPAERAPWTVQSWASGINGVGTLRPDHRRLFTTATACAALSRMARWEAAYGQG